VPLLVLAGLAGLKLRRQRAARRSFLWAAHYCAALATYPEVVTHRAGTCARRGGCSSPIWSCSVWGFPCHRHYWRRGALLPHLFTLTQPWPPRQAQHRRSPGTPVEAGRYVFCGTFRQRRLNGAARTLSGTLLCGVRTFLCLPAQPGLPPRRAAEADDQCPQAGSDRPAQQLTGQL